MMAEGHAVSEANGNQQGTRAGGALDEWARHGSRRRLDTLMPNKGLGFPYPRDAAGFRRPAGPLDTRVRSGVFL